VPARQCDEQLPGRKCRRTLPECEPINHSQPGASSADGPCWLRGGNVFRQCGTAPTNSCGFIIGVSDCGVPGTNQGITPISVESSAGALDRCAMAVRSCGRVGREGQMEQADSFQLAGAGGLDEGSGYGLGGFGCSRVGIEHADREPAVEEQGERSGELVGSPWRRPGRPCRLPRRARPPCVRQCGRGLRRRRGTRLRC
jgi:hypothetical protein